MFGDLEMRNWRFGNLEIGEVVIIETLHFGTWNKGKLRFRYLGHVEEFETWTTDNLKFENVGYLELGQSINV